MEHRLHRLLDYAKILHNGQATTRPVCEEVRTQLRNVLSSLQYINSLQQKASSTPISSEANGCQTSACVAVISVINNCWCGVVEMYDMCVCVLCASVYCVVWLKVIKQIYRLH